jgi:hypothetical protein
MPCLAGGMHSDNNNCYSGSRYARGNGGNETLSLSHTDELQFHGCWQEAAFQTRKNTMQRVFPLNRRRITLGNDSLRSLRIKAMVEFKSLQRHRRGVCVPQRRPSPRQDAAKMP